MYRFVNKNESFAAYGFADFFCLTTVLLSRKDVSIRILTAELPYSASQHCILQELAVNIDDDFCIILDGVKTNQEADGICFLNEKVIVASLGLSIENMKK
ncbi:hypothetical protein O0544_20900 [Edwardsiella anguillarum]|nr:hypothetical protein [Edwardsiella anguillarum]